MICIGLVIFILLAICWLVGFPTHPSHKFGAHSGLCLRDGCNASISSLSGSKPCSGFKPWPPQPAASDALPALTASDYDAAREDSVLLQADASKQPAAASDAPAPQRTWYDREKMPEFNGQQVASAPRSLEELERSLQGILAYTCPSISMWSAEQAAPKLMPAIHAFVAAETARARLEEARLAFKRRWGAALTPEQWASHPRGSVISECQEDLDRIAELERQAGGSQS